MRTEALGDHVEILSGFAFKSERFNDDGRGLPLVRIRDVKPATSQTYYDGEYDRRFVLSDGDLLVGMDGEFNCARWAGGNALLNQRVCRIRAVSKFLDEQYLFWFLPKALKEIEQKSNFVTVKHLSAKQINEIEIPLPPLEEQKRIAAILDQADELRRKRQRALDRLNQLGQAIFIEMFSGADRNGWTEKNLSELCDIQVGFAFKSSDYTEDADAVRLCRGANILPGRIDWSDTARLPEGIAKRHMEFALREGDIVIAMDRPWISDGFKVARMEDSDLPALLVQRVARLRAMASGDSEFLYYLVNSLEFQKACRTTETTVPHISPRDIRSYSFFCPPGEQRNRFTQRISLIRDIVKNSDSSANHSHKLFSSLQHRAFRGELTASSLKEAAA